MPSLNKVMLIGNLTRDPEVRYTPKGTAVADIGLACNRSYTLDSGERREDVTYIDVTLWGRSAELVGQYMKKGRPIYVEGRLQLDQWEDKQTGQKRNKLKVVGENFQFLGGRDDGGGGGGYQQDNSNQGGGNYQQPPQQQQQQQQQYSQQGPPPEQQQQQQQTQQAPPEEEEIPF